MSESTEVTADAGEQVKHDKGAEAVLTGDQWQAVKAVADESFKAPASQADLDRIVQTRLDRERARFADYDEVKERAAKAAEFEAANAELLAKVQGFEAAETRTALVRKVAGETGVDADILADLRADTEEDLAALASKLRDRFKQTAPLIPGQEKRPENAPVDERKALASKLFG